MLPPPEPPPSSRRHGGDGPRPAGRPTSSPNRGSEARATTSISEHERDADDAHERTDETSTSNVERVVRQMRDEMNEAIEHGDHAYARRLSGALAFSASVFGHGSGGGS